MANIKRVVFRKFFVLNTVGDGGDDDNDLSGFCWAWQVIPFLPPLVAFYDMQENTAVQFYSPQNHRQKKKGGWWW